MDVCVGPAEAASTPENVLSTAQQAQVVVPHDTTRGGRHGESSCGYMMSVSKRWCIYTKQNEARLTSSGNCLSSRLASETLDEVPGENRR